MNNTFLHLLPKLTVCLLMVSGETVAAGTDFVSASSANEVRDQISRLPGDDIWWTVYGEDQGWNFRNLHRFMPTVTVYRQGPVSLLAERPMPGIARQLVTTPAGNMPFGDFLHSEQSRTMGLIIMHRGDIVFEDYPRQQAYEKPIFWSVTKVLVSAVVGILEDRGLLDVRQAISHYLPALTTSDYKDVTVRNVLDMATGVACPEEYVDKSSCYYRYSVTVGDGYWDENSPDNPYHFLATLKPGHFAEQGTVYQYSGVNTFLLSWLVEELTGMPFQDVLSREIWSRIGAEADASIIAPRYGVPVTHGGLLARLRDVARFGLLYTPSYGKVASEQVISDRVIALIRDGGNAALMDKARAAGQAASDLKHNVYQWDAIFSNNDFYKGGWAGQGLLVNPDSNVVAVFTGYFKKDRGEAELLPILRQVLSKQFPLAAATTR